MLAGSLTSSSQAAASSGNYRVFFFSVYCLFVTSVRFVPPLESLLLLLSPLEHDPMVTLGHVVLTVYLSFSFFHASPPFVLIYYTARLRIETLSYGISPLKTLIRACLNRDAYFLLNACYFLMPHNYSYGRVGLFLEMGMTNGSGIHIRNYVCSPNKKKKKQE